MSEAINTVAGKEKTQQFFLEPHTPQEKISFLKDGYGIGGHSPAVSGEWHSGEWHDGKGIRLKKDKCETLQLGWPNVAKRIMELIQQDRYLTPDEKAQFEAQRASQRVLSQLSQEQIEQAIREWNGDSSSKLEVVRYLRDQGPDDDAEWLMERYSHAQLATIVRKQESFVFEKTALLYSAAKQVKTVYID